MFSITSSTPTPVFPRTRITRFPCKTCCPTEPVPSDIVCLNGSRSSTQSRSLSKPRRRLHEEARVLLDSLIRVVWNLKSQRSVCFQGLFARATHL